MQVIMMKQTASDGVIEKVAVRIKEMPGKVVLRKDVNALGSPHQISRALQTLIKRYELVRIGKGIYAKAYYSTLLNKAIPKEGFEGACLEALDRLGVRWEPTRFMKAYNEGRSTQVPVRVAVRLKSRFRGQLVYGDCKLRYEDNVNCH